MRFILLRFFEDSSKFLKEYSLRGVHKLLRQVFEPFLTSQLFLLDKRSKKNKVINLVDIYIGLNTHPLFT